MFTSDKQANPVGHSALNFTVSMKHKMMNQNYKDMPSLNVSSSIKSLGLVTECLVLCLKELN